MRRAAASAEPSPRSSFLKNLSEISLDKHRDPPPVGPAGVFSLFPAEEAEGEEGAEGGQGEHAADRGQDAARTDAEEPGKRAAQPHAPQQRRRGQRCQRHEAVDDVHGQLDAQNEHRADRRHAEALEDLQLPQAGYGLRLSMARKRLSRPLTGAACFAIFRHE